jgi:hypothetical protein
MKNRDDKNINLAVGTLKIIDIAIKNAHIENKLQLDSIPSEAYQYSATFKIEGTANYKSKKIKINFLPTIEIVSKADQSVAATANFEIAFTFEGSNAADFINAVGLEDLNPQLYIDAVNITYSTSRGIIFSRCQGTLMNKIFLPIISSEDLAKYFLEDTDTSKLEISHSL